MSGIDATDIVAVASDPIPHLDGNALGGLLMEIFRMDVTAAVGRCDTCGDTRPVAEAMVYRDAPGVVVRCKACAGVLLCLVDTPDRIRLDVRGLSYLDVARDPDE
ncbi:DUF6510 family protein [Glaciibacter sp. 2TAF33]|uniref:DUF6510 family protein n=1 Tax=Glaciibacter sp. 2TAF33 TaxID=3233015 RepID=UPI003F8F10CD